MSAALGTVPHAAFRTLAILVAGKTKESNGTMMCSDSYAAKFGLKSHGTVQSSLEVLEARGIIVTTRKVQRMKRFAALYAVTWWPIHNRNGLPLEPPEPPTYAYRSFTPIMRVKKSKSELDCSPRLSGDYTPIIGSNVVAHHPDLTQNEAVHRPDNRVNSKISPQGPSASAASRVGGFCLDLDARIEKLVTVQPHLPNGDVAKILHTEAERVARVRERMSNGRRL